MCLPKLEVTYNTHCTFFFFFVQNQTESQLCCVYLAHHHHLLTFKFTNSKQKQNCDVKKILTTCMREGKKKNKNLLFTLSQWSNAGDGNFFLSFFISCICVHYSQARVTSFFYNNKLKKEHTHLHRLTHLLITQKMKRIYIYIWISIYNNTCW